MSFIYMEYLLQKNHFKKFEISFIILTFSLKETSISLDEGEYIDKRLYVIYGYRSNWKRLRQRKQKKELFFLQIHGHYWLLERTKVIHHTC